ncbi:MAG: L,D-transpeptidase family protein, partial [Xanthobacteraceae bacterium]|nr:L,D-transpeptidase family protein [Xanthobacteraceae bacterium]
MAHRFARPQSTVGIPRRTSLAVATFAAIATVTALTAAADARQARPAAKQARPAPLTEATAPRPAGEPIMAIVSIKSQQVTFYDGEDWILRAPVSTGTTGRETPAGVFAVIEKDKDHHSSLYDDAWMPNMQRITWNGIALHGGPLPGYAASHGCVRMPYGFAEKLFDKTRIGMRV